MGELLSDYRQGRATRHWVVGQSSWALVQYRAQRRVRRHNATPDGGGHVSGALVVEVVVVEGCCCGGAASVLNS